MLLSEIDKIENGKIMTKDGELFECPHCKSTFSKDFAKNRMKRFGKDKQFFYNTKHCPNCDGRILMKDQNKDALRRRIEQLKQYAYQCGITGDLEEKRDALKEAANLEAEFKSLTENLPIKDTLNAITAESIKNMPDEQIRHHIIEEVNREGNGAPVLEDESLTDKVIAFFKTHPNPPDAAVHAFAQQLNIAPDVIETEIYKLVTKYVQTTKDMEVKIVKDSDKTVEYQYKGYQLEGEDVESGNGTMRIISPNRQIVYTYKNGLFAGIDDFKRKVDELTKDKRIVARDTALKALDELKKTKDDAISYKGYFIQNPTIGDNGEWDIYLYGKKIKSLVKGTLEEIKEMIDKEIEKIHMQHHGLDKKSKDSISIGKHNDISDDQFDANELAMGIKVEMEHTDDPDIAKSIAKDHIKELKNYYTLLLKMEKEAKGK